MRQSLHASHFKIVDESKRWIGYWGRHLKTAQYRLIKPYQKVNHFPGAFHMGRKDRLWQHISEMMELFPDDGFDVMPKTYILPKDAQKLKIYLSAPVKRHVILKPPASARGTGIEIVSKFNKIPTKPPLVAQHYVERPLTINGFKFDLRLYVYVNSLDPLRIYLYEEGLVRFASIAYSNSTSSYTNQYMHLTNYSINKLAQSDGASDGPVPKWKLSDFWIYLRNMGLNASQLREDIKDVAIKAVIACESHIRAHQSQHSDYPFTCHELFGMDILVDEMLRPWLLEMNISPSLHSQTAVDVSVKAPLAKDVLNMCGLPFPPSEDVDTMADSYRVKHFYAYKTREHLFKEVEHLEHFVQHNEIRGDILNELTDADVRCLIEFEDELVRRGAFELVYPLGPATYQYLTYINKQTYFNLLLSEWQRFQVDGRQAGVGILEKFCADSYHIAQPEKIAIDEAETEEELLDEA
ncbi:tubulin-tyrosine ligase [Aphelenchoides avenae]|nr:tubulin-tyrosine ligase [Aphelenchus avenae]